MSFTIAVSFQQLEMSVSLRRTRQLTSVCFAATSFPRKEANDPRLRRRWNPKDSAQIT